MNSGCEAMVGGGATLASASWLDQKQEPGREVPPGEGTVSVLVPVFNEAATLESVLGRVLALGPIVREVVVVDDGSTDATPAILRRIAAREPRVRAFSLPSNRGKTAAVRRAMREARGNVLVIQDADLEYDPAEIPQIVGPILTGEADVVYGSRFLRRPAGISWRHYAANRLLTWLSNELGKRRVTDMETCYKAFRAGMLQGVAIESRRFGLEVELTAILGRTVARFREVPISYRARSRREGKKIGVWDGLEALWYLFYYNVVWPRRASSRAQIAAINAWLGRKRRGGLEPTTEYRGVG